MEKSDALSLDIPVGDEGFWLLGCGSMGGALLGRWLGQGLRPAQVTVVDPMPTALAADAGVTLLADLKAAGARGRPKILVLGIKPQLVAQLAPEILSVLSPDTLVISMLAGVRIGTLQQLLPGASIVRIMPNLAVQVGKGVIALFANGVPDVDLRLVETLAGAGGYYFWADDENRFDAITAVSGSGPAFLYRFIETLAGAAETVGLDPELAAKLAIETVYGAASLAAASDATPAVLRQQVTSPNGVTQAGLDVLDGDGALSSLLRATLRAATERSRALASAVEASLDAGGR